MDMYLQHIVDSQACTRTHTIDSIHFQVVHAVSQQVWAITAHRHLQTHFGVKAATAEQRQLVS